MSWKPDIVLYHGGCNDGFGAAWACWKKWGQRKTGESNPALWEGPQYFGMGYADELPFIHNMNVLFVDFSLKRDAMIEAAKEAKSIVVLDHHKTAEAELAQWTKYEVPPADMIADADDFWSVAGSNVRAHFDMEKSGARLAWEFCFPDTDVPMMLEYIEDRDLWRFSWAHTHPYTKALSSYPHTFDQWDYLAELPCAELVNEGNAIARYHDKMVADACANVIMVNVAGHSVPTVNVPYFLGSDSAAFLLKRYPDAPFAAYYLQRGDGMVQWGLRSEDHRMDCSEIAKKFGGGGHRNASGFTVPGC